MTRTEPRLVLLVLAWAALALPVAAGAQPPDDVDSDGTPDVEDFCLLDPLAPSPRACDTDLDGYGNSCDADWNNDGTVGAPDFPTWVSDYGQTGAPGFSVADTDCDGTVGAPDGPIFHTQYGGPPGPSGLACAGTITCP